MERIEHKGTRGLCTLHLGYLQLLLDCLRESGIEPAALYPATWLAQWQGLDTNTRRPLEEWEAMMAAAEDHVSPMDLALRLAKFVKPWDTGPIGFITMASRTLREAAESLAQFYNLLNDVYVLDATLDDSAFELRLRPIGPSRSPRLERLTLATMAWHARWLSRRPGLSFDACFAFPPPPEEHLAAYQRAFKGTLTFDAAFSGMRGPAAYASHEVSRGDHGVSDTLRLQLMSDMESLHERSASFVHHIERLIRPRLQTGQVSLDEIAEEAGVSARTLQNRLEGYGLTFRELLDRMRHEEALLYMANPALSLIDIAQMLGFATQSSFHHAFRRWTGLPPGQYRRRRSKPPATAGK